MSYTFVEPKTACVGQKCPICNPPQPPCYGVPGAPPSTHAPIPNIWQQMGTDPISRLAAAIEKLADAVKAREA